MEEVGAQVVPSIFMYQTLSSRFCEPPPMSTKRKLSYQNPNLQHQQHAQPRLDDWNPKLWNWDSVGFVAKPLDSEVLRLGGATASEPNKIEKKKNTVSLANEEDGRLNLNLADGLNTVVEELVRDPGKGVGLDLLEVLHILCARLTIAWKICRMQRIIINDIKFVRFHPLLEFDEGKRSCRRRLAGHNWRRRKTQPEDVTSLLLIPGNQNNTTTHPGNLDILNLLTAFAQAQGKSEEKGVSCALVPDRDQLIMIRGKINSLPLPPDLVAKLPHIGSLNRKYPEPASTEFQNRLNGNTSSPSIMDLLAVLSATLSTSGPDALAILSQRRSHGSDSEKTKSSFPDEATPDFLKRTTLDCPYVGERSSTSYQSPDSESQIQEARVNLPLQLFSSSFENDSPPKLSSSRKYFSSDGSNPIEERSPSSSPVVQTLFPMRCTSETVKPEKLS